jgi:hypothetical protein
MTRAVLHHTLTALAAAALVSAFASSPVPAQSSRVQHMNDELVSGPQRGRHEET